MRYEPRRTRRVTAWLGVLALAVATGVSSSRVVEGEADRDLSTATHQQRDHSDGSPMTALVREDATWTWFHDPRAVRVGDVTYLTWAATDGIYVGAYDNTTGNLDAFNLLPITEPNIPDDHHIAAVGVRPDGRLIAAYSLHNDTVMRVRVSTNAHDVTAWGTEQTVATGGITYPNLVYLAAEGRWYLFYRQNTGYTGRPPAYVTSTDDGANWTAEQQLTTAPAGQRPYLKVTSNGVNRMDFLLTDRHPTDSPPASIYHFYYENGSWFDSGGVNIGAIPDHVDMTLVHDGNDVNSWIWDIAFDGSAPVVAITTFPSDNNHRYQWGRWNQASSQWEISEIVGGGGNIDGATQPHYSGGMSLNQSDPSVVYVSRQVSANRWDIERYQTSDTGQTWTTNVLVSGGKNMRPVFVRGDTDAIVYFAGTYETFNAFNTDLYHVSGIEVPGSSLPPALPPVAEAEIRTEITWLACDLVTGRIITDLPEIIPNEISRVLANYTSSSLSVPIPRADPAKLPLDLVKRATQPPGVMVVAVVNDIPIWAGIASLRQTGNSADVAVGFLSPEGYLRHRFVRDHSWVNRDEASVIAAGLFADAGSRLIPGVGLASGIGLVIDAPSDGMLQTVEYSALDRKTVYDALRELTDADGPEWTIDLDWEDAGQTAIAKIARVRRHIGLTSENPAAVFQATPGSVFTSAGASETRYTEVEDFSDDRYANYVVAYSSGQGEDQPESDPAIDASALTSGIPLWERYFQPPGGTSITDVERLNVHAQAELERVRNGAHIWTLTSRWDVYPRYGVDWRIGDDIAWEITSHWWPAGESGEPGVRGVGRCIGFDLDLIGGTISPILIEGAT